VSVTKITDNIYFLKGLRSSNIYFFNYKKRAIIDTGYFEEFDSNYKIFLDNGFDLKKVDYIINTHSHGDHNGANALLKKYNPSIKIYASDETSIYQKRRDDYNLFSDSEDNFDNYKIDIELGDNSTIDLGDCELKVIKTKGHTIDSISLYLESENILFSGDTVYNRVIPQIDYYQDLFISLKELNISYQKLLNLNLKTIYTGHGEAITNPNENLDYCIKKMRRFERDIELPLINNLIPSIQFLISKYKTNDKKLITENIYNNLFKLKKIFYLDENRFDKVIEKAFSLMRAINIIKVEDDKIYLVGKLNEYFGNIKN